MLPAAGHASPAHPALTWRAVVPGATSCPAADRAHTAGRRPGRGPKARHAPAGRACARCGGRCQAPPAGWQVSSDSGTALSAQHWTGSPSTHLQSCGPAGTSPSARSSAAWTHTHTHMAAQSSTEHTQSVMRAVSGAAPGGGQHAPYTHTHTCARARTHTRRMTETHRCQVGTRPRGGNLQACRSPQGL
jgi:hypothetical protein